MFFLIVRAKWKANDPLESLLQKEKVTSKAGQEFSWRTMLGRSWDAVETLCYYNFALKGSTSCFSNTSWTYFAAQGLHGNHKIHLIPAQLYLLNGICTWSISTLAKKLWTLWLNFLPGVSLRFNRPHYNDSLLYFCSLMPKYREARKVLLYHHNFASNDATSCRYSKAMFLIGLASIIPSSPVASFLMGERIKSINGYIISQQRLYSLS